MPAVNMVCGIQGCTEIQMRIRVLLGNTYHLKLSMAIKVKKNSWNLLRPQHSTSALCLQGNYFLGLHLLTEIWVIFSSPLVEQGESKFIYYGTDRLIMQSLSKN